VRTASGKAILRSPDGYVWRPQDDSSGTWRSDVPVRSVHANPLPVPDQPRGFHSTTAGKPYSRASHARVIRPPTSVTSPLIVTSSGVRQGHVALRISQVGGRPHLIPR
jgi:hypothetical protein